MCDTLIALGNSTADGSVIFAKNSDREPNEAHHLLLVPHDHHEAGSSVKCTYVSIPQVAETYAVLLAKPFWIWGAEMGANECGVVIGNEALFSKAPAGKEPGLIGMDFLRLALERAGTARAAMEVITSLLNLYGQGGNCGFKHPTYYHNSYLIVDRIDAWVLETVDKQWAAEKVKDVRSISNAITIGRSWDLASDGLVDFAIERGWCKDRHDFDFGRCYSDAIYTRFGQGRERQCRTQQRLHGAQGQITPKTAMDILRDHGQQDAPGWTPARGVRGVNVCMHAGFGPIRIDQSTGSMVSHFTPGSVTHWFTGTSAPCTGIFKPVWMDAGLPTLGPVPGGEYDAESLWWRHEALHRAVLRDYATRLTSYRAERDRLEQEFIESAAGCLGSSREERAHFTQKCFDISTEADDHWTNQVRSLAIQNPTPILAQLAWRGFNRQAKFDF